MTVLRRAGSILPEQSGILMRTVFPLLIVLFLIAIYCGYAIVAETAFHRGGAAVIPGMQSSSGGANGPERLLAQPAPAATAHAVN